MRPALCSTLALLSVALTTVSHAQKPEDPSDRSSFTVIHNFTKAEGQALPNGVRFNDYGQLVGVAQLGGANGLGTAFSLTPSFGSPTWAENTLYNFTGTSQDGTDPGSFTVAPGGRIIGTIFTPNTNTGKIYELTPAYPGSTTSTVKILYTFNGKDGSLPNQPILGPDGAIYGTTFSGGANFNPNNPFGSGGVAYKLSPPTTGSGEWTETILHDFSIANGAGDGSNSFAKLTFGRDGVLYGTTSLGGAAISCGTVFQLTPPARGQSAWTETILHTFLGFNAKDGCDPDTNGITIGNDGALYSETATGGNTHFSTGDGTFYKITPPTDDHAAIETILFVFGNDPSGIIQPDSGLTLNRFTGVFYGTSNTGGANNGGLYSLTPPAHKQDSPGPWVFTKLHEFSSTEFGSSGPLQLDFFGNIYGATSNEVYRYGR